MKYLGVVLLLGACAVAEPDADPTAVERYGTEQQGTEQQGTEQQGTEQQGTEQQGGGFVGTAYEGTQYVSSSLTGSTVYFGGVAQNSVKLNKTTLELWRRNTNGTWTQRTPTQVCTWDSELVDSTCTTYNLTTQTSPLVGARFMSTFKREDGTTFSGGVYIAAVKQDTSYASHTLNGVSSCPVDTTCDHPTGCRKNCDLFVYDLRLYNTYDSNHDLVKFCPNTDAYPLAGTWSSVGQRTTSTTAFTFACMNGVLAKCTKWGYRPFGSAKNSGGVSESLAPYHQSCVHAARADYCGPLGHGHSFTKNGTIIDIYDYAPHQVGDFGFIPSMRSYLYTKGESPTNLIREADFDNLGAKYVDELRYEELVGTADYGSLEDPELGCPDSFSLPQAGETRDDPAYKSRQRITATSGPMVSVATTTPCSHTEFEVGKYLHWNCSKCTEKAAASCVSSNGQWDANCVKAAADACASSERMGYRSTISSLHGECSTGAKMYQWASACTLRVCDARSTCCSSSWDSTCVSLANQQCTGGREQSTFLGDYGFCGTALSSPVVSSGT